MGMFDVEYTFDNLIRATSAGVEVSSFVQVKDAIAKRYKEIFGNDIDIESTTADGQFLMMIALMLYNGYNGVYYLNQNLDPAGAQGVFLDRLCSFNNIFRKDEEPSYAYLYVNYMGSAIDYVSTVENSKMQSIECVDGSGKVWRWEEGAGASNQFATKFTNGKIELLKFVCQENGPIAAKAEDNVKGKKAAYLEGKVPSGISDTSTIAILVSNDHGEVKSNHGDIGETIDQAIYPFEVWQAEDAVVGNDKETDSALRSRRVSELGNNGTTVINGLIGGLLSIAGVEEAKVYSNNKLGNDSSGDLIDAKDGSKIKPHDVYVCVRYKDGVSEKGIDEEIGQKIYEKMTPGIVAIPINKGVNGNNHYIIDDTSNPYGTIKKYNVDLYGGILQYDIYWKKCKSICPSLQLTFMYNPATWNEARDTTLIKNAILNYMYNLTIYDDIVIPNLLSAINASDLRPNNQNTFVFINGKVAGNETNPYITTKIVEGTPTSSKFNNKDTYYDYSSCEFTYNPSDPVTTATTYKERILDIYLTLNA